MIGMIDWLASGATALLLDQWSKRLAKRHVRQIRRVRNHQHRALVLTWLAAFASAVILYRTGVMFQSHPALIGLGLAFGGAASNLLDIWRRRLTIDFIDLGWWPVF